MSNEVQESYIRQAIDTQQGQEVTIAWQGGEPTLMGQDFFRRAIEYQRMYQKPGATVKNTLQTNGTLLDDAWCEFLHENGFLVGLSLDGPRELHDTYRRDKRGNTTFNSVMHAARLMQKHKVNFNILATVNAANAGYPLEVYRFLRDEVGARFIQFIPIVERAGAGNASRGEIVTERSVSAAQYGRFLISVFDEWVRRDVGDIFVQLFDGTLASWFWGRSTLCIFQPTCGRALALEHNGDLYSCDHFVEPHYLLGNITDKPLRELAASEKQRAFGESKMSTLPRYCQECDVLFACYGECPKNRFIETTDGEHGLNFLCNGLKAFFHHVDRPMRIMTELLRRGQPVSYIMQLVADEQAQLNNKFNRVGRNDPCPCGSGFKFKRCHGNACSTDLS